VIELLRAELANPEALPLFIPTYNEERKRLRKQATSNIGRLSRRAGEIERELTRLLTRSCKASQWKP